MRLGSHPLQCLAAAMSSSNARGRNPWRRGFCDRPPPDSRGGGRRGGFVSGDSHIRTVRDANLGYRQGFRGDASVPGGPPYQPFQWRPPTQNFAPFPPPQFSQPPPYYRPSPPPFRRPTPQSKPADHRYWVFSESQPPPQCERFTLLSYNILADHLARDHRAQLYSHIPHHILDWEWRKRRLLLEFHLWAPEIICLQEVDHFHDLEEELARQGYNGIWKRRTGNAVDGCAVFWQTNRFKLRHEENIEYSKLGLRDNVAQILVLESSGQNLKEGLVSSLPGSSDRFGGTNLVVICNIHVLYNPKRGEIKLGQVRILLDRAFAVSRHWSNAPVVVCGDFNCTPKSPLYNYILEQKLSLSGLARNQVSGQFSATLYPPRPYAASNMYRSQPPANWSSAMTSSGGQGSDHPKSDHYTNSHNCVGDTSSRAEPLQTSTEVVDMSGGPLSDDQNIKETNEVYDAKDLYELVNQHKEDVQSFDLPSRITFNVETDEQQAHVRSVSGCNEPCSGELHQNGRMSDIVHSIPSMLNEHFPQSKSDVYDKLIDSLDPNQSCKDTMLSQGLPDSLADVSDGDLMFGSLSLKEVGELKLEDAIPDGGNGIVDPSGETSTFIPKSASQDELSRNKSENHTGVYHGSIMIDDLCTSEESSDPSFFKELLGNEDECAIHDNIYSEQYQSSPIDACKTNDIPGLSGQIVEKGDDVDHHKSRNLDKSDSDSLHDQNREDSRCGTVPPYHDLSYDPFLWTPMEIETASGDANCNFIEHNLRLRSAYRDVKDYAGTKDPSGEPQVTSYHRRFMGTVDYIWYSDGLQTVKVLDTIPKHVLQRTPGFPTQKWGSDHLALVCQLAFRRGFPT